MMTNILAAITVFLQTNTTEAVTGYESLEPDFGSCAHYPGPNIGCTLMHYRGVNPNAKTITTKVEEVTVMKFNWMGEEREVKSIKPIWSTNVYWTRGWALTNQPTQLKFNIVTNIWTGR